MKLSIVLSSAIVAIANTSQALKLSIGKNNGNHVNRPDLSLEAKLIETALTETHNFIYNQEVKSPQMNFKFLLQSKILRRLQGAIDRWLLHEEVLREAVISDSYQQVQLFDDAIVSLANSKALLGYVYWKTNQDSIALHLLESSCPLLWEYHAIIRSPDVYNWLDCYISLRDIYGRDRAMNPKDLDKVFMTRFPWITMSVVDKSIMSLRLRPRSLLSELASVSRQDLEMISYETRRGWAIADEMRGLLVSGIVDFINAKTKEQRREIHSRIRAIVVDITSKFQSETSLFDLESLSIHEKDIGSQYRYRIDKSRIKSDLIEELSQLLHGTNRDPSDIDQSHDKADISISMDEESDPNHSMDVTSISSSSFAIKQDESRVRVHILRSALFDCLKKEGDLYVYVIGRLVQLLNDGDSIETLLESVLRTDNFSDGSDEHLKPSTSQSTLFSQVGYQSLGEVLQIFEYYIRQQHEAINKRKQTSKLEKNKQRNKRKTSSHNKSTRTSPKMDQEEDIKYSRDNEMKYNYFYGMISAMYRGFMDYIVVICVTLASSIYLIASHRHRINQTIQNYYTNLSTKRRNKKDMTPKYDVTTKSNMINISIPEIGSLFGSIMNTLDRIIQYLSVLGDQLMRIPVLVSSISSIQEIYRTIIQKIKESPHLVEVVASLSICLKRNRQDDSIHGISSSSKKQNQSHIPSSKSKGNERSGKLQKKKSMTGSTPGPSTPCPIPMMEAASETGSENVVQVVRSSNQEMVLEEMAKESDAVPCERPHEIVSMCDMSTISSVAEQASSSSLTMSKPTEETVSKSIDEVEASPHTGLSESMYSTSYDLADEDTLDAIYGEWIVASHKPKKQTSSKNTPLSHPSSSPRNSSSFGQRNRDSNNSQKCSKSREGTTPRLDREKSGKSLTSKRIESSETNNTSNGAIIPANAKPVPQTGTSQTQMAATKSEVASASTYPAASNSSSMTPQEVAPSSRVSRLLQARERLLGIVRSKPVPAVRVAVSSQSSSQQPQSSGSISNITKSITQKRNNDEDDAGTGSDDTDMLSLTDSESSTGHESQTVSYDHSYSHDDQSHHLAEGMIPIMNEDYSNGPFMHPPMYYYGMPYDMSGMPLVYPTPSPPIDNSIVSTNPSEETYGQEISSSEVYLSNESNAYDTTDPNIAIPPQFYYPYPPYYGPPYGLPHEYSAYGVPMPVYGNEMYMQGNAYTEGATIDETSQEELIQRIQQQIEYYFSEANLSKDMYLRSLMDSQGFVKLSEIFKFRRIKNLYSTPAMLLVASRSSSSLEVSDSWAIKTAAPNTLDVMELVALSEEAILNCKVRCREGALKWVPETNDRVTQ